MVYIYILSLQENKYYVGKSNNPVARIKQHAEGYGSQWCKKYLPIIKYDVHPNCSSYDEDKYVKMLMEEKGIPNVRGGSYPRELLTANEIIFLQKELDNATDRCYKCKQTGHFISECKNTIITMDDGNILILNKMICSRCGRNNHLTENCYAKTHLNGNLLYSDTDYLNNDVIFRCSNCCREGHLSKQCPFSQKEEKHTPPESNNRETCKRCNRSSHDIVSCKATTYSDDTCIRCYKSGHNSSSCEAKIDKYGKCSRCGKSSHNSDECMSSSHIKGYALANGTCSIL